MSQSPTERETPTEAEWRVAFRPHAIIATDRSVPSPIFGAALIGVAKILRIDFDTSLPEETYLRQALAKVPEQTIAFGSPIGVTVNYAPDRAVRYDLTGDLSKLSLRRSAVERRISGYFILNNWIN